MSRHYTKVSAGFASSCGRAIKVTQAYQDIVHAHGKYINVRCINMPIVSKGLNTAVRLWQVVRVKFHLVVQPLSLKTLL